MLVKTHNGIEMEFMGDAVFVSIGTEGNGVFLKGDSVTARMVEMKKELEEITARYHRELVSCLDHEEQAA